MTLAVLRRLFLSGVDFPVVDDVALFLPVARWIAAVLARFVVALPVLVIACWLGGLPGEFEKWPGARGSIAVAGAYFGTLAYAEWSGTYLRFQEWLLKNAATMKFRRGRP
jgi:hypothetical protein